MRAPPLASRAAVAAPRPDADPVTIAYKPSLDIAFPLVLQVCLSAAIPHSRVKAKLRYAEFAYPHATPAGRGADIAACHGKGFSPSCGARRAVSAAVAGCAL